MELLQHGGTVLGRFVHLTGKVPFNVELDLVRIPAGLEEGVGRGDREGLQSGLVELKKLMISRTGIVFKLLCMFKNDFNKSATPDHFKQELLQILQAHIPENE